MTIGAIVVTHNRRALLTECLDALMKQSLVPDRIIIVDNASTDGTPEFLSEQGWLSFPEIELLRLETNAGGAGGFAAGLAHLLDTDLEWAWMMDDDAIPHPDALAELIKVTRDPRNVYGSLAVNGETTPWPVTLEGSGQTTRQPSDIPMEAEVVSLPFLGFLIHRSLVVELGLPDAGFFIAADDIEYCTRARFAGSRIIIAGRSLIDHPKAMTYEIKAPGYSLTSLRLPPWKRYYDTRNRLLISRRYYGVRFWTQTIPGTFLRMVGALTNEPQKAAQMKAFFAGLVDGILGRKGRRHQNWGIQK